MCRIKVCYLSKNAMGSSLKKISCVNSSNQSSAPTNRWRMKTDFFAEIAEVVQWLTDQECT